MTEPKGWLLLDVDGPLNPYACKSHDPPAGFVSWRRLPDGVWLTSKDAKRQYRSRAIRDGILVRLHPDHGAMLSAVANESGLALAWATTWRGEANRLIGPSVGLPELPIVGFPVDDLGIEGDVPAWVPGGRWKYPGVATFAAGKPLAWLDDEFSSSDHTPAREWFLTERLGLPTLLHNVSPQTGITDEDLKAVAAWASNL